MSTATGRQAEDAAAEYLLKHEYKVLEQNWRTRWCEIDVVAQKDNVIFFVEVKYRRSADWGSGLEYITDKKLRQMTFAAEFWVSSHKWKGGYQLGAAEVTGTDFAVTSFIDNCS